MRQPANHLRLVLTLILLGSGVRAESFVPTATQVKVAYLYNFTKFVEWPETQTAGESFSLCIYGNDPLAEEMNTQLEGKSVGERKLVLQRVESADDAKSCHLLYIGESARESMPAVVAALEQAPVLTVSDIRGFMKRGIIEFIIDNGRLRFGVNVTAAQRAGLIISSDLLKVAKIIKP